MLYLPVSQEAQRSEEPSSGKMRKQFVAMMLLNGRVLGIWQLLMKPHHAIRRPSSSVPCHTAQHTLQSRHQTELHHNPLARLSAAMQRKVLAYCHLPGGSFGISSGGHSTGYVCRYHVKYLARDCRRRRQILLPLCLSAFAAHAGSHTRPVAALAPPNICLADS